MSEEIVAVSQKHTTFEWIGIEELLLKNERDESPLTSPKHEPLA
jgi:hypothetical protein